MNTLLDAAFRRNKDRPPVWMMRQAGRYHQHYQNLRKDHSFVDLCKTPSLAVETTLGPIRSFDFDAAILFSDLLFPLEAMGMDLTYDPGPKFKVLLESEEDFEALKTPRLLDFKNHPLHYQFEALQELRRLLPHPKGLIGFVGSPFTLYLYARRGTHEWTGEDIEREFKDHKFEIFWRRLKPLLISNMIGQLEAGANMIAIFDTSAGVCPLSIFRSRVVPLIQDICAEVKAYDPNKAILYYSRETSFPHWDALTGCRFDVLGVDWREDLVEVFKRYHRTWCIQGNADPLWLTLPEDEFQSTIEEYFERILRLASPYLNGWICGLGHGVTPQAREENVLQFVRIQKRIFKK